MRWVKNNKIKYYIFLYNIKLEMSNTMSNDDLKKIGMIIGGIGIIIIIVFLALMFQSEKFESKIEPNTYLMELRMKKCYSLSDVDAILNLVPGTYEMIENGKVKPDTETKERLRKLLAKCDEKDVDMIVSSVFPNKGFTGQAGPMGSGMSGGMIPKGFTGSAGPMGMGIGSGDMIPKGFTGSIMPTKEFYESKKVIRDDIKYKADPFIDKDVIITSAILEFIKSNKKDDDKFKLTLTLNKNNTDTTMNYSGFYEKSRDDIIYLFNTNNKKIGSFYYDETRLKIVLDIPNNTGLPDAILNLTFNESK